MAARSRRRAPVATGDPAAIARLRLLTLRQVLAIIPVHRATWWRWVSSGVAPKPVMIGGKPFWRAEEIVRLATEGDRGR